MDSYSPLLERLKLPQPTLQKFAVISIFEKLKSSLSHLNPDSNLGREAISQCLLSNSPPVIDQSVRQLCRLVKDGILTTSLGLLELQSSLENCNSRFVDIFVKGIGFLIRNAFQNNEFFWCFEDGTETHPFVRILAVRNEVQSQLVQQVLLFIVSGKQHIGFVKVLEFLRPFLNYSVLRIPFSSSRTASSSFARDLLSSIASLSSSFPSEALPIIKLLMQCLKYFPSKNADDFKDIYYISGNLVDAYTVALTQAVETGLLKNHAQSCGVELVETLLSFYTDLDKHFDRKEAILELSKRVLLIQKQFGLPYLREFSSLLTSFFVILTRAQFEHEQLSVLKLSFFLLKWKTEIDYTVGRSAHDRMEELLFLLPVINLLSSPSRSVKAAATNLLLVLQKLITELLSTRKEVSVNQEEFPFISNYESVICRLFHRLWFQEHPSSGSYFLCLSSNCKPEVKEMNSELKSWLSHLREYCLHNVEKQRSSLLVSQRQENVSTEFSLLLSSVVAGLVVDHHSLESYAVDTLATLGIMDPKLGMPLLFFILFYSKFLCKTESSSYRTLLKLLEMLPSVASHPAMTPLVVQTVWPMLNTDEKPVLRATANRLLCKTWEVTDRVFASLQGALQPKGFIEFAYEQDICISMAASVRDVCRKDPDRGVDLILSVSACIESSDPIVQALGFQSLGYLCEADVVDFYTAWTVIEKRVACFSGNPIVAHGISILLRWGAMDAEAHSEASKTVLDILWKIATVGNSAHGSKWVKAKCSAFESLAQYEVEHIQKNIPDFKRRNFEFLVSEDNPDVLRALERFVVKIIDFQHNTRPRLMKTKRFTVNMVDKLLDDFPHVVFHSENSNNNARDLPGATLLCTIFSPKETHNQGSSEEFPKLHAAFETALVDVADSLQLSRNPLVALLSLQSFKPFMQQWVKAVVMLLDAKVKSCTSEKTTEAASIILKKMRRIAEESIPRSAENVALGVGALCLVLPPSAHTVATTAAKFLLTWLFQFEHEHRQWSAAITLGFVSHCSHSTDQKQKFDIITGLLKVACSSKSTLVKGACGVGLGLACQDLLAWDEADGSSFDESSTMRVVNLVGRTVRALSMIICHLSPSSSYFLQRLSDYFPLYTDELFMDPTSDVPYDNASVTEVDVWGIAGLILGLGNSVSAIFRAGGRDAVITLKAMLISWIPHVQSADPNTNINNVAPELSLSVGSCLALPVVIDFCLRVELVTDDELNDIVRGFGELISELLSVKISGTFHQSLSMASCIGGGSLLSCILDYGVHSVKIEDVKGLLELLRKSYTNQYPTTIQFGGVLGVVNALGAGAGTPSQRNPKSSSLHSGLGQKDSCYIRGPILSEPVFEQLSTSLVNEMFLAAKDAKHPPLQNYAAWALSFLRSKLRSKEPQILKNNSLKDQIDSNPVSQNFPEDCVVWQLSLWLMELSYVEGNIKDVNLVATFLRCLSQAPRLPSLDWGAIIRRCMRYEDQVSSKLSVVEAHNKGTLRIECIMFALAHANHVNPLLLFLDELYEVSRFRTLELNLQTCLLGHLVKFMKIFSGSRLEKLFDDMDDYFSCSSSLFQVDNFSKKSLLRVSFWKGLGDCLEKASVESLKHINRIEKCMQLLFTFLPALHIDASSRMDQANSLKEWSEAIRCMGMAPQNWLMDLLEIPEVGFLQGGSHFHEVARRTRARVRLVMIGRIPLTELGKLRSIILHTESDGIWDVLVEVVSVLQKAEGSIKRQWFVDAVELACITNYPSTAVKFLGMLAGSCCKYTPLLVLDKVTVLSDLPVTLPLIFSESDWMVIAEPVVLNLWRLTERIYEWAKCLESAPDVAPEQHFVDKSESNIAVFLSRVMYHTCINLKDYLPFEKQLKLTYMVIP